MDLMSWPSVNTLSLPRFSRLSIETPGSKIRKLPPQRKTSEIWVMTMCKHGGL
jgi:hypothetical protein